MSEHTPTPWQVGAIYDVRGWFEGYRVRGQDVRDAIQVAGNRALMERAVNSHAVLREALEAALPYLEHSVKFYRYQRAGREFWPNREEAEANIIQARAALKEAGP